MELKLYNELSESTLIRNKSYLKQFNMRDILDFTFLYMLAFQILRNEAETKSFVEDYIYNTTKYDINYERYKQHGNDMYQFLHLLFGKDGMTYMLKDSKSNKRLIELNSPNLKDIAYFLNNIRHNRPRNIAHENRLLLKLESDLMITESNYRSMRRLIRDWDDLEFTQKSNVMTRLLQAFRTRIPRSELRRELELLANKLQLFNKHAKNAELKETIETDVESIEEINQMPKPVTEELSGIPKTFWYNPRQKKMIRSSEDHLYYLISNPEQFGLTSDDIEDIRDAYPHNYQDEMMKVANSEGWVRGGKELTKGTNGIYLQTDIPKDALNAARQLNRLELIDELFVDNFDDTDHGIRLRDDEVYSYLKHGIVRGGRQ